MLKESLKIADPSAKLKYLLIIDSELVPWGKGETGTKRIEIEKDIEILSL